MLLPNHITFTGIDESIYINDAEVITRENLGRIEWGVLFSPTKSGNHPRYPDYAYVKELARSMLPLSAHICGYFAKKIIDTGDLDPVSPSIPWSRFQRVQVNYRPVSGDVFWKDHAVEFSKKYGVRVVLQHQLPAMPTDPRVDWLYDPSGGRGLRPEHWPRYLENKQGINGYSGGLNPDKVVAELVKMNARGPYYIDMESGVRTVDDKMDLMKVRQVLERVYGESDEEAEGLTA